MNRLCHSVTPTTLGVESRIYEPSLQQARLAELVELRDSITSEIASFLHDEDVQLHLYDARRAVIKAITLQAVHV